MDAQLVREYRERWDAVAAVEAEEQRMASMTLRWQQLNSILRLAAGLGLPLTETDDDEVVYHRWSELRAVQR